MKCFAHSTDDALGICKSCGKGVCKSCALLISRGLACSEECKPYVEALSRLQGASIRNIGLLTAQRFVQPLMAAIFLATGSYFLLSSVYDAFVWFLLAAGGVFSLSSVLIWVRQLRSNP